MHKLIIWAMEKMFSEEWRSSFKGIAFMGSMLAYVPERMYSSFMLRLMKYLKDKEHKLRRVKIICVKNL